jgi:hypothetical protein
MFAALLFLHTFFPIQEHIPDHPFCYPGIKKREVIVVDPQNAPLLEASAKDFVNRLTPEMKEEEILRELLHFVRDALFDPPLCTNANLQNYILQSYGLYDEIPIDYFLSGKTGVCRHLALTSTYIADYLVKTGWLKGEALLIRDDLPSGRHAWTLFLSEEGAWHLDACWNIFKNGKNRADFYHLCQKYGRRVMKQQEKRWKKEQ